MKNEIKYNSRTWAEIDFSALKHNLTVARNASNRPVMCVIKANAYGHGAVECGRYLQDNGAAAFAVACIDEAIELRENGIHLPILILGYTSSEFAPLLAEYDLIQTAVDFSHAEELNSAAENANVRLKVHVKIDTGMGRAGILAQGEKHIPSAIDLVCRIFDMSNLDVEGMYTHMSVADTESQNEYTNWQIANFESVRGGVEARGKHIKYCHASNSASILNHKRAHFDMVREGIMLYGLYPDSLPVENGILKPVMTLKSRVGQVKEFPEGSSVSYGRTFESHERLRTAVITAGNADGYPRRLSNNAFVVINGKSYNQIGRVCMDMIMADIKYDEVKRGDEVILFGNGGMSVEAVSQIVGTINYEITCLVTQRAKRHYING
jgi:alanine racemase